MLLPKNADFLKKMLKLAKLRGPWYQKVCLLKLHTCLYLCTKFQVSSITPTTFRQEEVGNFIPTLLPPQNEPLKNPPRLGLKYIKSHKKILLFTTMDMYDQRFEKHKN